MLIPVIRDVTNELLEEILLLHDVIIHFSLYSIPEHNILLETL